MIVSTSGATHWAHCDANAAVTHLHMIRGVKYIGVGFRKTGTAEFAPLPRLSSGGETLEKEFDFEAITARAGMDMYVRLIIRQGLN